MSEKITYLIANHNKSKYIENCLISLFRQTNNNWNAIIVDDNSTDDSVEFINDIINDDERFMLYVNDERIGYTRCLIKLIDMTNTDIVGILDSDDALADHATEVILREYSNNYKCFVYSNYWHCERDLIPVHPGYCHVIPKGQSNITSDGVSHLKTFRRKEYYKTDGYDAKIVFAQDKDISYKMEEVTELHFVDDILYYHRHLPKNRNSSHYSELAKQNAISRRGEKDYGGRKFTR